MNREEILILLTFLLFVQGYLFQNVFPALLATVIVLYLLYLRLEFSPKIEAERVMESKMVEGRKAVSKLRIKNLTGKRFRVSVLETNLPFGFKVELPEPFILNEFEEKTVEYYVIPVRGTYKIRGPLLRVEDIRGIHCVDYAVDSEIEVEVYPSIDRIKEEAKAEENVELANVYVKALLGLESVEVHSLRKFQPGDDLRRVEWKATARLGELIVKDLLKELEGNVYIILDAGKEMRKGVRNSKIDYASTLTLLLAYCLRRYGVGLIVYDDFGVVYRVEASKDPELIERIVRALKMGPVYLPLLSVKTPEISLKLSDRSRVFLQRILPIVKRRRSLSSGLVEAVKSLPSTAFLIFVVDITAHTSELVRVLSEIKDRYKIVVLTPNPILFYDAGKLNRETLLWLYRRYIERGELIKKMNKIVPTLDLGPSDLVEVIRRIVI